MHTTELDKLNDIIKKHDDEIRRLQKDDPNKKRIVHHVIDKIPKKGMVVLLGGLKYKVIFSDDVAGVFHAKQIRLIINAS